MKNNLPYLNKERLNIIFDDVYNYRNRPTDYSEGIFGTDEKLNHLADTLKSMQSFNYPYRFDDTRELFFLVNDIFNFERGSEGTTIWLSLILAIKELYGFSDKKLITVLKQVTIRK